MVGQLPPTRGVTQEDRDNLLIPLASGVQELLFAPVNPFNDRPGFVAGPPPETGLASAVQAVTRLNCRLWASRDKSGYSPRVNQYNGEVCGPYLDSLGENPDGGYISPPFFGGQCDGLSYVVGAKFPPPTGRGDVTTVLSGPGPIAISGPVVTDTGSFPNTKRTTWQVSFQGNPSVALTLTHPADIPPGYIVYTSDPDAVDNCGNPPTVVQPPSTITPTSPIVPTITIGLPGVGPTTINVDIDVDGNPIITAPDVDASITIAPELDLDIGGGGGGGDPGDPTDPGDPGDPEGTGSGGEAAGEAPPGTELVGLLVTVAQAPGDANKFANNPKQPFRGIGYVRMGFPGRLGLDISGGTVINPQFFHAQQRGLTAWAVAANTGFNLTIQPYFRNIET